MSGARLPSPRLWARLFRRLAPHLSKQRGRFAIAALGTLGAIAVELLAPWPLKIVVDTVLGERPLAWLPAWLSGPEAHGRLLAACAVALVALAALGGLFAFVRDLFGAAAGQRVVMSVREEVHRHVQALGADFHLASRHGDLLLRLTGDLTLVRELLVDALLEIGRHLLLIVGMATALVVMAPKLGLVALAVVPLIALLQQLFQKRIAATAAKTRENEAKLAAHTGEMLTAMELVHAYQLEERLTERFHDSNRKSLKSGLAGTKLQARLARSLELALAIGVAATLWLGAREVQAGALTVGSLLMLLAYVKDSYKPLRQLSQRAARAAKAAGAATRLLELLEIAPTVVEKADARELPANAPARLAFRGVGVRFGPAETRVLEQLDLVVEPGRRVLLLGRNGAGKSTLLSLVPRLRDPAQGVVEVGGVDVRDLTLASLRSRIGWLPQEPALFDGTIADNLRLGRADASAAELREAATRAGLPAAFGDELPIDELLERKVGERGRKLSGGQRMRVALARLLLRRPAIVLLDEPEAAVDARSRGALLRALFAALPDATALVVSHAVSAPELFDEAVLLDDGRIVARGPVAEVVP
ncbi:MAG: ABC transporter ATP-binding protein [Planctomycetes bacterium]|nr:ABC transporter ATP-binding protein [Planctomycetota bacterium]